MDVNIPAGILVMFVTIYAVRALPLTLLRREIKSPFIRSFLHYVPYVSLSVMTFPAILSATADIRSGAAGFAAAVILAWTDGNLFKVSIGACLAVYIAEMLLAA
ncbi:MAG: AzlD domain-containing protein [Eubacteriales bacterium]|nr:AzlD domain-containing protein [Eubacteriales bacterium]